MATPQTKELVLRSPAGAEVVTYPWPLQTGTGSDKHDSGIDIIETIRHVCDDVPEICSAFEDFSFNDIDTACYKTMSNLVDRFNKAVDGIIALEKGTSLPAQRLNKYASPLLLRHILQLVYNAAVIDPDKLNQYEPFSPEVYGETSYELIQQMIEQTEVNPEDTFIDLGSGVGQVVLQMAGSSPLKSCIGIEKAEVPSRYAEMMDLNFRLWMNWFGKKFGDYQLIKGDFLADEHREKINSSTLVFVNNFAFGPNVDHQLKERFADLRDGARIVSSKSFCPLNFRITDRNLSDIGTIMHVSEMSPLKGSVSWTGKPVSYYLHIIDRTKLERYFQRLKNQKSSETDTIGTTTRSTRERAKRETPKQTMDESSTETEGEITGPTTRRAWSDWCSSKGKSSQSDDEDNNHFSTNSSKIGAANNIRVNNQKKRKKLTRKAANMIKKNGEKSVGTGNGSDKQQKQKRGRVKKGRGRRNIKIVGLDVLHKQTLLSTSVELMCKKLPPAPGCVDQQLTSLTGDMSHAELDIPTAPSETPYALQILLDMYRTQFMQALEQIKSNGYKENVNKQIEKEKERNQKLLSRASQLEKQIKVLIDDSVALLKARMNELGISMTSQNDLLAKAKEIVGRHKELQVMAAKLQNQVNSIEQEQKTLVLKHVQNIAEKFVKQKNGETFELTPATSYELVLKEIANTLAQRKKLHAQVSNLENELVLIEKAAEERKTTASILAQQNSHLTITNVTVATNHSHTSSSTSSTTKSSSSHSKSSRRNRDHRSRSQEWPDVPDVGKIEENNPEILAQKILETGRQIEAGKFINTSSSAYKQQKEEKKNNGNTNNCSSQNNGDSALMPAPITATKSGQGHHHHYHHTSHSRSSSLNLNLKISNYSTTNSANSTTTTSKIIQESPKVVNFEDRLKSIITSVLNEDQEQRKAALQSDRKPNAQSIYNGNGNKMNYLSSNNNQNLSGANLLQMQQHNNNINNILTVVTQGLTHLNSTTTISPITPPPFSANPTLNTTNPTLNTTNPTQIPVYKSATSMYNIGKHSSNSVGTSSVGNNVAAGGNSTTQNNISQQKHCSKNLTVNVSSGGQTGHLSISNHSPSTSMFYGAGQQHDFTFRRSIDHGDRSEFKAPENMRYEKHIPAVEENIRSNSSSSDSAIYYSSARDRIFPNSQQQQLQTPSRPNSSSSQPDYTQVSPAKMALRRHLSQEKLAQQIPSHPHVTMMATKTIGDLVNGEIERTLEISHQSIINAAVNMSTVGSGSAGHDRPIINPNVPRPERVNVRVLEDPTHHPNGSNSSYSPISRPNSCENVRKTPPIHLHGQNNPTSLAHVAYNHKIISQSQPQQIKQHLAHGQHGNHQHNTHSNMPMSNSRSSGHISSRSSYSNSTANIYIRNSNIARESYSNVPLPRAEMKPYLESYFTEDQKPSLDERPSRIINGNPPLEGLAASLQARVIASLKIKEENEERQRRSEMHYSNSNQGANSSSTGLLLQSTQIKTEAAGNNGIGGTKRTSPLVQHPSRPAKIAHYSEPNEHLIQVDVNHSSSSRPSNQSMEPALVSPEINSLTLEERTNNHPIKQRNDDDDVLPDDETQWQDRVSSGFDRLVAFASTELDKTRRSIENDSAPSVSCNTSPDSGITHSSNNSDARIFLSTSSTSSSSQLDVPIEVSSGGSTNSNSGGNGSGSSSTSSSSSSSSSSSIHVENSIVDHLHHRSHHHNHRSNNRIMSYTSDSCNTKSIDIVPMIKTSPTELIESPPLSEGGLPRTPSPSTTPPLVSSILNPSTSSLLYSSSSSSSSSSTNATKLGGPIQNTLKIPLKYQRQLKNLSSEKHYKKKFRERTWEYDYDDYDFTPNLFSNNNNSNNNSNNNNNVNNNHQSSNNSRNSININSNNSQQENNTVNHKSSKFRPKGKDWDWSNDSCKNKNNSNREDSVVK